MKKGGQKYYLMREWLKTPRLMKYFNSQIQASVQAPNGINTNLTKDEKS